MKSSRGGGAALKEHWLHNERQQPPAFHIRAGSYNIFPAFFITLAPEKPECESDVAVPLQMSIITVFKYAVALMQSHLYRLFPLWPLMKCTNSLQQRPLTKKGTQCLNCAFTSTHGLWLNHRGKMLIKLHHTHLPWFWFTGSLANFTGRFNHCEKSVL